MNHKHLFLDYDEVLVDLINPWINWVNFTYNADIKLSDITCWDWLRIKFGPSVDAFWEIPGIYDYHINPLPGAIDFFNEMNKKYNVTIISTCSDSNFVEKANHAKKYFHTDKFISSEFKWMHTGLGILVDDRPVNILGHIKNNFKNGIVFNFNGTRNWCNEKITHLGLPADMREKLFSEATSYKDLALLIDKINNI